MKCLIDEDVPTKLIRVLKAAGHEASRVTPSTPDPAIAAQALQEDRVLVTLDNDFTNKSSQAISEPGASGWELRAVGWKLRTSWRKREVADRAAGASGRSIREEAGPSFD